VRPEIAAEDINGKLGYARRRLGDLLALNGGNFSAAPAHEKHQLVQEFFFHLLGSVEWTAQLVNQRLTLGFAVDDVTAGKVLGRLGAESAVGRALAEIYANPRREPLPADPYSPQGLLYRAYNYRHQVTHRRGNPFVYRVGSEPPVTLELDPRQHPAVFSERAMQEELSAMLNLVATGCTNVIEAIELGIKRC
jgi:hypothetical protein